MDAWKFEAGPAAVSLGALALVGLFVWTGKLDATASLALVGAIVTQAGLKPALSRVPPSERITQPEVGGGE